MLLAERTKIHQHTLWSIFHFHVMVHNLKVFSYYLLFHVCNLCSLYFQILIFFSPIWHVSGRCWNWNSPCIFYKTSASSLSWNHLQCFPLVIWNLFSFLQYLSFCFDSSSARVLSGHCRGRHKGLHGSEA